MRPTVRRASTANVGPEAGPELASKLRAELGGAAPKVVVVFAATQHELGSLLAAQQATFPSARIIGASTAGEFTDKGDTSGAAVAFALAGDYHVFCGIGHGLRRDVNAAVAQAVRDLPSSVATYTHSTALVLLDGMAGVGEAVTLNVAMLLGEGVQVAGGAAGADWTVTATHVGIGREAVQDAVVVVRIFSKQPIGLGVRHGHHPVSEPVSVTRAHGNLVHELDGKPAWDRYVELTRQHALEQFAIDPLGLAATGDVMKFFARYLTGHQQGDAFRIKTPVFVTPEKSIGFACEIPEGTVFRILSSSAFDQLDSAREAARVGRAALHGAKPVGALVFDCACRKVILGNDFSRAAQAISDELGGAHIAGFESYGEVALDVGDFSGFHNATTVCLVFGDRGD